MSSNKRQRIEEYHDPDYCQDESTSKTSRSDPDRLDKIKMIIKREFLKEINAKEEEINLIDHKLTQTKRLLQRVRYAVAMSYYTKKNLVHSANELKCENSTSEGIGSIIGQQTAIHPSLKKLLGKKPIDYGEILKSRSPRNAAKTARSTLIKPKKKETITSDKDVPINEKKIPRYISPTKTDVQIEKINSSRGRNQTSHLIVVGNTSKYIGDEKSHNEVTHKWLVYIKTKTAVGIEDMVSKVRFFLHPSYKPNDVIEVDSPPFQISRRGWGEFPIRVQLYFHESVNQKPLQIYHNLILDKKMTGLQTMGAETVVEIWLDLPIPNKGHESESKSLQTNFKKGQDVMLTKNSYDAIEKREAPTIPINIKVEEPLMINDSPQVESQEEIPETYEYPSAVAFPKFDLHQNKSNVPNKSSQGCLNDISEIFKDAAPLKISPLKINSVDKVETVKSKPPVQQKKTLVRCLDTNGKIVFVELQVDPNNPKNIKIVKSSTVIAASQNVSKLPNATQLKLNPPLEQIRHTINTTPVTNILSNTSNSPKQYVGIHPVTSTRTIHSKPMMVQSNANMSRILSTEAKSLIENKKLFLIKSSTLPNVTSTNPPPLVRISNPTKVALAPSTTNAKVIHPATKPTETRNFTINANNVIMKNGQIIILDKDKSNVKQKQESLLKPQVSLLKPLFQKQVTESTLTKSNAIQKPSCQSIGPRFRKSIPLAQNTAKRDYHKEFCSKFLRHHFITVRSAVEYVLRNVQLINILASRPDYSTAFPFVAESYEKFNSFSFPKRQTNEWYRAKFVIRMLQQHPDLRNETCWMPREIIIFGRRFGFTPANIVTTVTNKHLQNNQNPIKDMIKQHIKEEQLKNLTITFNNKINDFIKEHDDLIRTYSITSSSPMELVDIEGDNEQPPNTEEKPEQSNSDKLVLDVNKIMQSEGMLVTDICKDIQIKLHQEEIVDGVLCSSSQLMLWQAMRSFMEELIRRSFATKPIAEQISDLSAERFVRVDDVKKAISTTVNFSFLTNKYLGKQSS